MAYNNNIVASIEGLLPTWRRGQLAVETWHAIADFLPFQDRARLLRARHPLQGVEVIIVDDDEEAQNEEEEEGLEEVQVIEVIEIKDDDDDDIKIIEVIEIEDDDETMSMTDDESAMDYEDHEYPRFRELGFGYREVEI